MGINPKQQLESFLSWFGSSEPEGKKIMNAYSASEETDVNGNFVPSTNEEFAEDGSMPEPEELEMSPKDFATVDQLMRSEITSHESNITRASENIGFNEVEIIKLESDNKSLAILTGACNKFLKDIEKFGMVDTYDPESGEEKTTAQMAVTIGESHIKCAKHNDERMERNEARISQLNDENRIWQSLLSASKVFLEDIKEKGDPDKKKVAAKKRKPISPAEMAS